MQRTDELVDGPNASHITPEALDQWEARLEAVFDGRPMDVIDAALTDTVSKFPVDIQPFRDMIDGMRMDLVKPRYETFDELYEYCYRVAGTVGLMSMPIMGCDDDFEGDLEKVYKAALSLGLANQLTNILRDVGEDVQTRNRIYIPLEELAQFGITEEEIVRAGSWTRETGKVDAAVEGVYEVPNRARARGVRGSGGRGELPPRRRAVAGVVRAGRVPEHPGRHRGERLRQLHATRVRAQVAEVFDASLRRTARRSPR